MPNFPHFNPEAIAIALFNLLQTSSYTFASVDRRGRMPENVPSANQPYMGLVQLGGAQVEVQSQGMEKWLLHFRLLVYIRADANPDSIPATELNAAWKAIVEVMRSGPQGQPQTLGDTVDNAYIDGDCLYDTGILDQQCALMIPITVNVGF